MVGAVRPGDGDLSVPDGDGVVTVHGEFLVDHQIDGFDELASGGDPGEPGFLLPQQGKAQGDTGGGNDREKDDPGFCFHGSTSKNRRRERRPRRSGGRKPANRTELPPAAVGTPGTAFPTVANLLDSIPKNDKNSKKKLQFILDNRRKP